MRVTVFGSSGRTGRLVVQEALRVGHEVVAFSRRPVQLEDLHPPVELVAGQLTDREALQRAVQGSQAVLSVLAPSSNRPEFAVSRALESILEVMQQQGVNRLVATSGAGIGDPLDAPTGMSRLMDWLVRSLARNVYADMLQAAQLVRASPLDWTLVRVPMLTDRPGNGQVKVAWVGKGMGPRLARADLAVFLVSQVEDRAYLRQSPAVSN